MREGWRESEAADTLSERFGNGDVKQAPRADEAHTDGEAKGMDEDGRVGCAAWV